MSNWHLARQALTEDLNTWADEAGHYPAVSPRPRKKRRRFWLWHLPFLSWTSREAKITQPVTRILASETTVCDLARHRTITMDTVKEVACD